MFIDDNSIKHILKSLDDLIAFCIECEHQTSNDDAWDLYSNTRCQLECIQHDIATHDDFDDDDDDDDEEEENE